MPNTLHLASTPLHSFFSLGLMNGALRDGRQTLAVVDQPDGARDFIAEAIAATPSLGIAVHRYTALSPRVSSAATLQDISRLSRSLKPSTIVVGNDRRLEFYAAVRGCPSARCVYADDGLYSYIPSKDAKPPWRETLSNWRRSIKYGLPLERPSLVGGSRFVHQAYVLLPRHVHAGLAGKPVDALQPEWFSAAATREVCQAAAALAGVDALRCASIRLLLLLPHPRFLGPGSPLVKRLEGLAAMVAARGELVAVKLHPQARNLPLHAMLPTLPADMMEIPARLPAEVLLPVLSGSLVVGAMSTSLLTLHLLGDGLTILTLPLQSQGDAVPTAEQRVLRIYESVGIQPLPVSSSSTAAAPLPL